MIFFSVSLQLNEKEWKFILMDLNLVLYYRYISFSTFGVCFDTYYNISGAFCGSLQPLQEDISCLQAEKVSFSCSFYRNWFGVFIAFYSIIYSDITLNALFNIILNVNWQLWLGCCDYQSQMFVYLMLLYLTHTLRS